MNRLILGFIIIIFLPAIGISQGIEFMHDPTWEELVAKAKEEKKVIFIDAYTVWCGPCKRMSKNVFTDQEIGDFYNKNFINVKFDMEKSAGRVFGSKYPVSGYPTLYFIDYSEEIVLKEMGAKSIPAFLELGKKALNSVDRSGDFVEEYEKGNRAPELVYNYVEALIKADKPNLKIANDYLRSQEDLSTPQNLKFILMATTEADSRIFDLLLQYKKSILAQHSEEIVTKKVKDACNATVSKAIEYDEKDLLLEAQNKMNRYDKKLGKAYKLESNMSFSLAYNQADEYIQNAVKYSSKYIKNNPEKLFDLAKTIRTHFSENKKAMLQAEVFAKKATAKTENYDDLLFCATIMKENGHIKEALKTAKSALPFAQKKGKRAEERVNFFIKDLEKKLG